LEAPNREMSGYRRYEGEVVQRVRFIKRAQELGFTLEEISGLLELWTEPAPACGLVEQRATDTLGRIDEKIAGLQRMRAALAKYVTACRDGHSLDECPLLAALGGES